MLSPYFFLSTIFYEQALYYLLHYSHNKRKILKELLPHVSYNHGIEDINFEDEGYVQHLDRIDLDDTRSWNLFKACCGEDKNDLQKIATGTNSDIAEYSCFFYLFNFKNYLPLTDDLIDYLVYDKLKITIEVNTWELYFRLSSESDTQLYKALVLKAKNKETSEKENELINSFLYPKKEETPESIRKSPTEENDQPKEKGFRFLGIRILDDTAGLVHKIYFCAKIE